MLTFGFTKTAANEPLSEPLSLGHATTAHVSPTDFKAPSTLGNPFMEHLKTRLKSHRIRGLMLELVHSLSGYIVRREILEQAEKSASKPTSPDATPKASSPSTTPEPCKNMSTPLNAIQSWPIHALETAHQQGLIYTEPRSQLSRMACHEASEIHHLLGDLDETVGNPGVIKTILAKGHYGISLEQPPSELYSPETCSRMLHHIEQLLWGTMEPRPDDISFGHLVLPTTTNQPLGDTSNDALVDFLGQGAAMDSHSSKVQVDLSSFRFPEISPLADIDVDVESAGPSRQMTPSTESIGPLAKGKSPEELVKEGRARYQAWLKTHEIQPLSSV